MMVFTSTLELPKLSARVNHFESAIPKIVDDRVSSDLIIGLVDVTVVIEKLEKLQSNH